MNTDPRSTSGDPPTIEDLLLGDAEPPTIKLPTREMKLGALRRLDRTSEVVRPLQRMAPTLAVLTALGGVLLATLLLRGSRRASVFASILG